VEWPAEPVRDLLIRDVVVVHVETGNRHPNRDVLIRDGRIAAIEPTGSIQPGLLRVLNGRGGSLVPGLIDMHGHVTLPRGPLWSTESRGDPEANLRSYLYSGVTTVLDPSDSTGKAVARREAVRRRQVVGPRIYTAGRAITCRGGHPVALIKLLAPRWIGWFIASRVATQVDSHETARAAVNALADEGVDVVKVYVDRIPADAPRLTVELIEDTAQLIRQRGMRWVAHIGKTEDLLDTGAAGVSLWMHGVAKERIPDNQIARIASYGIPMVATIEVQDRTIRGLRAPIDPIPLETETVPTDVLDSFYPPPENFKLEKFGFGSLEDLDVRSVAADNMIRLRRAGVTILAGSDPIRGGVFPGPALHRELGQLVAAGLTPSEALRAATLDSATYLANGQPIEFGAVRVGLRADLLLIDGDPTEDISKLQAIREVIVDGTPVVRRPVVN
ncbi:MAG: amidohydrolase family protein, partial [Mycobacteriaceae bacterium]|nr:amidohydrolase family protein [Mycobacteriaceae bacterium]